MFGLLPLGIFQLSLLPVDQGNVHTVCVNHKEQHSLITTGKGEHHIRFG